MILGPLVQILLRNGVPFRTFTEIAKQAYVRVAEEKFRIPGADQSTTRIATLTGLTRKEVFRIRKQEDDEHLFSLERHNRASRVISAWLREPEFHDRRGRPAALHFDGDKGSFSSLVKQFSGDITARTILDELIHSGAATYLRDGRIKLESSAYIPKTDDIEKIHMLGTDVTDLIRTIDHNIECAPEDTFFQRKVWYNNIPDEMIARLRSKIVNKGQSALVSMNRDMASCDRDANPEIKGTGRRRVVLGIYYFEEETEDKQGP